MSKHTIKDIAKRAGVGTTTVSRVLNNHPYVSEEKREKVLRAVEELDYRPNFNARWLRGSNSGLIGFLTDEVATTPYAVDIIRGAQEAAYERDYVLLVMNTGPNLTTTEDTVEFLLERRVAGIVYAAMYHREVELPENIYQIPTALANCYVGDHSLPAAVPDEFIGGYKATRRLLEAGHRRIAFMNVTAPAVNARDGRLAGYKKALEEYGVAFDEALLGTSVEASQQNYETACRLLSLSDPPTAFFAGNDRTAMGVYGAVKEMGLHIPEDIGIVGFDNQVSIAENLIPALTTIQLPHYEMGRWAFEQLFTDDDSDTNSPALIDCALIERNSV